MHVDCQNAHKRGKDKYFPFSYHVELNIVNILVQKFQYFVFFLYICVYLKKKDTTVLCHIKIIFLLHHMCLELNNQYSLAILLIAF